MRFIQRLQTLFGVVRSLLIYHAVPFRTARRVHFYRKYIQPGDLCFDIGAHVGNHTRAMRAVGARVVAVEPQPHLMRWLQLVFGKDTRITLLQAAVGAMEGQADLHISHRTPTVTTLSDSWREMVQDNDPAFSQVTWDERMRVSVTTLDALVATHGEPVYCKLDIEGYEQQALTGLSRPLRYVSFEYIPVVSDQAIACVQRLAVLGQYVFNWSRKETMRFVENRWLTADHMIERLAAMPSDDPPGDVYAHLEQANDSVTI